MLLLLKFQFLLKSQRNIDDIFYDCNQAFRNELNFSIKKSIRSWYAVKQINKTRQINPILPLNDP